MDSDVGTARNGRLWTVPPGVITRNHLERYVTDAITSAPLIYGELMKVIDRRH